MNKEATCSTNKEAKPCAYPGYEVFISTELVKPLIQKVKQQRLQVISYTGTRDHDSLVTAL